MIFTYKSVMSNVILKKNIYKIDYIQVFFHSKWGFKKPLNFIYLQFLANGLDNKSIELDSSTVAIWRCWPFEAKMK